MKNLNGKTAKNVKLHPERIIQFGEGNFLRAFVDWIVYNMNQKAGFDTACGIHCTLEMPDKQSITII
jgi:tagaturonate reductase